MTHHSKTNCSKLNIHFLWCYLFKIASWWWHLVCLLCLFGSSGTINGEDATLAKEKWQTCRNLIWIKRWLRKGWLYKLLVNISLKLLIYCEIHSRCMIIWVFFYCWLPQLTFMIYKKNLTLVQRRAVSPQIFSTSSWRLFKLIYKRFVSDLPVWSKLQKQTMMLNFLHAITASLFNYFNYQCKVISSNYPHIFKQLIEISLKNNKVTIPNLWMAPGSITIIKIVNIWPHKQNYLVCNWV